MDKEAETGMGMKDHFPNTQAMENGGVDTCRPEFCTS
jgi:hypothetical protein